jgi:hypothetical protein
LVVRSIPQTQNRLRENLWRHGRRVCGKRGDFDGKRKEVRTPGPKGQMIWVVDVRAKARTYQPLHFKGQVAQLY